MRQGGNCARCGAMRHGKKRHVSGSAIMTTCALPECGVPICERHATWSSALGAWICTRCDRNGKTGRR